MSKETITPAEYNFFEQNMLIIMSMKVADRIGRYVGVPLLVLGVLSWQRQLTTMGLLLVAIRIWMTVLAGIMLFPGWTRMKRAADKERS